MKLLQCLLVLTIMGCTSASLLDYFRPSKWNALKVKWGPNPLNNFNSMPRTEREAQEEGFVKISDCLTDADFRGVRYIKNDDRTLILLYDVNGYIAGIQTRVPHGLPYNYPTPSITPPFIEKDDGFYLTAYFVSPDTICMSGRTRGQFNSEGTGTNLLIQNGSNPETDFIRMPKTVSGLTGTKWVRAKCFYTMGQHYYYDLSLDMNCDNLFPVFLLYNNDKLNAFGWSFGVHVSSPHFEYPPKRIYTYFMDPSPRCLYERGPISTMHIFLDSRPVLNTC